MKVVRLGDGLVDPERGGIAAGAGVADGGFVVAEVHEVVLAGHGGSACEVADVGGDDESAAGDFSADEFGGLGLALGDALHLRSDHAGLGEFVLRVKLLVRVGLDHDRAPALGA